jgi:hypothetical protein
VRTDRERLALQFMDHMRSSGAAKTESRPHLPQRDPLVR